MSENTPSITGKVTLTPSSIPPWVKAIPASKQRYRLITGADNAEFCERVSEALAEGYVLHGSATAASNGGEVTLAQAVIWPTS
ncbi:DUF1737 domain-containing protein [Micrococcales bacterium 31B]|nr:DUF1737 domain-containing protein [Micrococcales bacterium 31B]